MYAIQVNISEQGRREYVLTLHYDYALHEGANPNFSVPTMTPAQLDDWETFKKIEDEGFAKYDTDELYKSWQAKEAKDMEEVEEWRQGQEPKKAVEQ